MGLNCSKCCAGEEEEKIETNLNKNSNNNSNNTKYYNGNAKKTSNM
jgi:hypothetical protein